MGLLAVPVKNIDEVRYMENDPAFGIDWINLSLNSVLYNLKTGDVYTPNTNTINNINNPNNVVSGTENNLEGGTE